MRNKLINKAKEYIGYTEGRNNDTIFGDWYGLSNNPWCAMFISYCADKVGISQDIIKKFASCPTGFNWFKNRGQATREHITPKTGDIIFFVWTKGQSTPDHVGLVEYVEGNKVHTIEGNRSNKVQRFVYDLNAWQIYGYALPAYEGGEVVSKPDIYHDGKINCVYDIQEWLNNTYGLHIAQDNIVGNETRGALKEALKIELKKQFNTTNYINVRQGARGNITMLIQMALFCNGYKLDLDKIFGSETTRIVKQFQLDNNLEIDGIVGKNTFANLFE